MTTKRKVTITLQDLDNGEVSAEIVFDPPLKREEMNEVPSSATILALEAVKHIGANADDSYDDSDDDSDDDI